MQLKSVIAILLISMYLLSCKHSENNNNKYLSDTLIKDVPEYRNSEYFSRFKHDIEAKANIGSISEGFDSLQVRVWLPPSHSSTESVVIIKRSSGKWSGEVYDLLYRFDSTGTSILDFKKSIKPVVPKSGWQPFMDSLYVLKILTLPDKEKVPGYEAGYDGEFITVEIATKNLYRVYAYQSPEKFQDSTWQARNMVLIIRMLHDELEF